MTKVIKIEIKCYSKSILKIDKYDFTCNDKKDVAGDIEREIIYSYNIVKYSENINMYIVRVVKRNIENDTLSSITDDIKLHFRGFVKTIFLFGSSC